MLESLIQLIENLSKFVANSIQGYICKWTSAGCSARSLSHTARFHTSGWGRRKLFPFGFKLLTSRKLTAAVTDLSGNVYENSVAYFLQNSSSHAERHTRLSTV
jgi:hypothetical protein